LKILGPINKPLTYPINFSSQEFQRGFCFLAGQMNCASVSTAASLAEGIKDDLGIPHSKKLTDDAPGVKHRY
jgi:hypothetical protein